MVSNLLQVSLFINLISVNTWKFYEHYWRWPWLCRWNVGMPSLVKYSIKIISDAGLGMAMFSLGTYVNSLSFILNHMHICLPWSLNCRAVHGSSAPDNCLWNKEGNHGNGDPLHLRAYINVSCVHSCWTKRSSTSRSHSTGMLHFHTYIYRHVSLH